jgi:ubiquitin carboxyl-terminal hydrolase 3
MVASPGNNSDNSNATLSSPDQDSAANGTCHLIDCLSSFIELEELTETELYYCSNCQKKQRSTKRFWIRKLPDVLCLHLKRFRYNNFIRTKIDDYIQFPIQGLDMKRFVLANKHETRGSSCGPTTYDLVAFIEHHGSGVGSGHYTAYCRHEDYWFHFDDSSVTACDEGTVRRSKAYILFYNRRS